MVVHRLVKEIVITWCYYKPFHYYKLVIRLAAYRLLKVTNQTFQV